MSLLIVVLIIWLSSWAMTFLPPVVVVVDRVTIGPPGTPAFAFSFLVVSESFWSSSESLLRHEFAHLSQQRLLGGPFVFLVLYFLSWIPGWIRKGNPSSGYRASVFETWAERASADGRKPLPFFFKIDLTTEEGRMHSFWEETLMKDTTQTQGRLAEPDPYLAFREQEYLDFQESLKKRKNPSESTEVQTDQGDLPAVTVPEGKQMNNSKNIFEELIQEANETREYFAKKEALKEAKIADFKKKLQALRNKNESNT